MTDNLLVTVEKWAGQPENFLTDAFAHLLRNILANESEIGISLLAYLTNGIVSLDQANADKVSIDTQVVTPNGISRYSNSHATSSCLHRSQRRSFAGRHTDKSISRRLEAISS